MTALPQTRMSISEFLAWWRDTPGDQRYELVDGVVIAMAPERLGHVRAKARTANVVAAAIAQKGLSCEAVPDGVGVPTGVRTYRVPDVSVFCGQLDPDAYYFENPVVLFEVVSPSSEERDVHVKLTEYFRLPSLEHYIIVYSDRRLVVHHSRDGDRVSARFLHSGTIDLTPPGFSVTVEDLLGPPMEAA